MAIEAELNQLTWKIIKCAMRVHSALGPGLLESVYLTCLVYELRDEGLRVETQVTVPLVYRGVKMDCGFRIDVIVEGTVVLEVKTLQAVLPVHRAQLVTYLKLAGKPIGLLLNFNVPHPERGHRSQD